MKKKHFAHLAVSLGLACLLATGPILAKQVENKSKPLAQNQHLQASLTKEAGKKAAEKRQEIIQDAVVALQQTFAALKDLNDGNKEKALKDLSEAIGKLEVVVARNPELALAPVDVSMTTYDVLASMGEIMEARKQVVELMKDGNLPAARELLNSLRSEIVVTVTSLPLATYPDALKAVVPLIDAGKNEEAKAALESALSTLVVVRHIMPLPLLRADEALVVAEVLAEKKNRNEKENLALDNALNTAEEQLRLSEALGYGSHESYKVLQAELKEIRGKVSGGKSGTGFFDKIKASLESLKAEIFGAPENPKAAKSAQGQQSKEKKSEKK